jgi:hypothetical protein
MARAANNPFRKAKRFQQGGFDDDAVSGGYNIMPPQEVTDTTETPEIREEITPPGQDQAQDNQPIVYRGANVQPTADRQVVEQPQVQQPQGGPYPGGYPTQASRPSSQLNPNRSPIYQLGKFIAAWHEGTPGLLNAQRYEQGMLDLENHRAFYDRAYKYGQDYDRVVEGLSGELDMMHSQAQNALNEHQHTVQGTVGAGGQGGPSVAGAAGVTGTGAMGTAGAGALPTGAGATGVVNQTLQRVNQLPLDQFARAALGNMIVSGDPGIAGRGVGLANAYQTGQISREKMMQEIGKIQAETGEIGARTGQIQTQTQLLRRQPTPYGWMDPISGTITPYNVAQPSDGGTGAPPAPAAPGTPPAGAGTPAAPPLSGGALYPPQLPQPSSGPIRFGPEAQGQGHAFEAPVLSDPALDTSQPIRARAQMDPRNFTKDGQGEVAKEAADALKDARKDFGGAENMKMRLREFEAAAEGLPKGFLGTGPYFEERMNVVKGVNWLTQTLSGRNFVDPDIIGASEEMRKLSTTLGFDLARTLGSREAQMIVKQAIMANPSGELTDAGRRRIIAALRQAAQRQEDYYSGMQQWVQDPAHGGSIMGYDDAFRAARPPELYAMRAGAEAARVTPDDVSKLRRNPAPATIERFDRGTGTPGLGRLLVGTP